MKKSSFKAQKVKRTFRKVVSISVGRRAWCNHKDELTLLE